MNSKEFVKKLYDVLQKTKTSYMWGTFGQVITSSLIESKIKQYPDWYNGKKTKFENMVGKRFYGFDCIGLIKGILWGWNNGGADYTSYGVPDTSANGMLTKLKEVSSDFKHIDEGEAVWMDGHIGIYVGDGKVIECTPAWKDGVQLTACANIKAISGLHSRRWAKHGKLPYITYISKSLVAPRPPSAVKHIYVVKSGDTLSKIAENHKTTVAKLASLNKIKDPSKISIGQIIKLK